MVLTVYYLLLTILFMHNLDDGVFASYYVSGNQIKRSTAGDLVPNGTLDQVTDVPQQVVTTREEVAMVVAALQTNDVN